MPRFLDSHTGKYERHEKFVWEMVTTMHSHTDFENVVNFCVWGFELKQKSHTNNKHYSYLAEKV